MCAHMAADVAHTAGPGGQAPICAPHSSDGRAEGLQLRRCCCAECRFNCHVTPSCHIWDTACRAPPLAAIIMHIVPLICIIWSAGVPIKSTFGWILSKAEVGGAGMLDTVREMLVHDTDTMVVSNCLSVIQKVCVRPTLVQRRQCGANTTVKTPTAGKPSGTHRCHLLRRGCRDFGILQRACWTENDS